MVELLPSPWGDQFEALVRAARSSLVICSPYIGRGPCERLTRCLGGTTDPPAVHILTDLSTDNLLSGSTDAAALLSVATALPTVRVRYLPKLHAKIYVRDAAEAVVTSGNMTDGGLTRNHEFGVRLSDPATVSEVRRHATRLAELGAEVPFDALRSLSDAAESLRDEWRAARASMRAKAREAFDARTAAVNDELLTLRVAGRSVNAIFSDTVLYVLRNGPLTTADIHKEVQRIHPDLCDDTVDRVIRGQHFGKKWKHFVRIAQYHLKKKKLVSHTGEFWALQSPRS
jgi:hypothetical protein